MVRMPHGGVKRMDFRGQPEIFGEYGMSGTEPVINQECMLVHEKVDIVSI